MIAFATAVSDEQTYRAVALPSIERVAEADSPILTRCGYGTIQQPYNEMMDEVAGVPGLEALILVHQDLALLDGSLPDRARRAFSRPRAGLLGALGGRTSRLHCWLAPERAFGFAIGPNRREPADPRISVGTHEVDGVDGALLVLAPWVVRGLRFGESPDGRFHGYDVDISRRVRAHGGEVLCEDIPCRHHAALKDDYDEQRAAGVALARMWDAGLRPREWAAAFQL